MAIKVWVLYFLSKIEGSNPVMLGQYESYEVCNAVAQNLLFVGGSDVLPVCLEVVVGLAI